jgi:hypothetical protein
MLHERRSLQTVALAYRVVRYWGLELSKQSTHKWRWVCQPHSSAALYTPAIFLFLHLILISIRGWVNPMIGLDKLSKFSYLIGSRTLDLPVCRIVPQPLLYLVPPLQIHPYIYIYTHRSPKSCQDVRNIVTPSFCTKSSVAAGRSLCGTSLDGSSTAIQTNSVALSPQACYTDWATATCRRNLVPVDNLSFLDRSRYISFK